MVDFDSHYLGLFLLDYENEPTKDIWFPTPNTNQIFSSVKFL